MKKTALVTGAAGFIGSHLCDRLLKEGWVVYGVDNLQAGKRENLREAFKSKDFYFSDTDILSISLRYPPQRLDVVFHLAASKKNICLKDPRRDLDTNGKGTLKLLQMAKKNGAKKFIFSSTGSVYGDCGRDTISETTPLNPCSYYGISKEAGDRYVQYFSKEGLLDTTVLRYFHIYGPRQDWGTFGGVVAIWINNVLVGKGCVLSGDRNITRTFTYVGDVVEANIRAIETEPGTVLNISSGEQTALWALYTRILLTTKKECNISIAPGLVGDVGYYDVNNRESKKALGLKYTDFIPGLKETVHWHKERLGL